MGTLTINTSPAQDTRIASAFGKYLNAQNLSDPENPVPRNATATEVKAQIINFIKNVVFAEEAKANKLAFVPEPLEPT